MSPGQPIREVIVVGGYLYRPEPSYFEVEADQQRLFNEFLGSDTLRRLDTFSQCTLFAIENARRIADAQPVVIDRERQGVCVGTGLGSQATRVRYARRLAQLGPAATNPIDFPDSIDGAAAAHVAMRWGLTGPSLTFADGANTAEHAMVAACRQIAFGRAERMYLAVGDIFEPWMRGCIAADEGSPGGPSDAILALVLEGFDRTRHAVPATQLMGYRDGPARPDETLRFRDVTPSKTSELDLSGVLQAAGAWLGVTAPMGTAAGSCQDDAVAAVCSKVGEGPRSRLAFWRKVDNR